MIKKYFVIFILLLWIIGCGSNDKTDKQSEQKPREWIYYKGLKEYAKSECDAYFTWKDYDQNKEHAENATYIWMGEEKGKGSEGFKTILDCINNMPEESVILLYPISENDIHDVSLKRSRRDPGPAFSYYPFSKEEEHKLHALIKTKKLYLVYSALDQDGNPANSFYEDEIGRLKSGEKPPKKDFSKYKNNREPNIKHKIPPEKKTDEKENSSK